MASKNYLFLAILRGSRVLLLAATLALIGNGSGALFTDSATPGQFWNGRVGLEDWTLYSSHIGGQFFIFVICTALALASVLLAILTLVKREPPWFATVLFNGVGACLMLLGGVLEMWYGTGWNDHAFYPVLIVYRVNAWYAASVLFLFTLATFIGDIILVLKA